MVRFASRKTRQHAVMSEEFERELTREVLRTELLRVRALITTGCVMILFLTATYLIDPAIVNRVWRGTEGLVREYMLLGASSCSRSGSTARSGETSSSIATCR